MTTENNDTGTAETPVNEPATEPAEGQVQSVAEETEGTSALPKSEREVELESQLADEQHARKSAEGRLRSRDGAPALQQMQGELQEIRNEMKRERRDRDRRYYNDEADLNPEERRQALGKLDDEEQKDANWGRLYKRAEELRQRINPRLERAGISLDDTGIQESIAKWEKAQNVDELEDIYDEIGDLIENRREAQTKVTRDATQKELEETRQRFNQENGTLDVGANSAGVGQSGNMSDKSTFDAYGRGEIPWSKRVADAGKNLGYLP